MIQTLINIAFLTVIIIPVSLLVLFLYQNLLEDIKTKTKTKPNNVRRRTRVEYIDTNEISNQKLRIVK